MKESNLEKDCRDLAEMMGWVVYKGSGRVGAPDKIFLKCRHNFTCEMKRKGGVQRDVQKREEQHLQSRGVPYYIIRSLEEFKTVILNEESLLEKSKL